MPMLYLQCVDINEDDNEMRVQECIRDVSVALLDTR